MKFLNKKYFFLTLTLILSLGIGTFVYAQTSINKDFNFTNNNTIYNLQSLSIGTSTTNNNAITFSDGTVFDQGNANASWTSTSTGIIYNSGNVGIGISNPNSKLDVNGAIYGTILYDKDNTSYYVNPSGNSIFSGDLRIANGTSNEFNIIESGTNHWRFGMNGADFYFEDSATGSGFTKLVTFETGGNVGIGTTNPGAKLDVNGTVDVGSVLQIKGTQSACDGNQAGVIRYNGDFSGCDGSSWSSFTGGGGYWDRDSTNGEVYPSTIGDEVGIGTTNPTEKLHIQGTGSEFMIKADSVNNDNFGKIVFDEGDGGKHFQIIADGSSGSGSGRLRVNSAGNGDVFTIERGGNVGIGDSTPNAKLHVNNGITRLTPTLSNQPQALRIIEDGASTDTYGVRMGNAGVGSISGDGRIDLMSNVYWRSSDGSGWRKWDSTNDYYGMYRIRNGQHNFFGEQTTTDSNLSLNRLMTITPSGNVGIGTDTPDYVLEIQDSQSSWLGRYYNDNNEARAYFAHGGGYGMFVSAGTNATDSNYAFRVDAHSQNDAFHIEANSGQIGIKTSNPGADLDVNGNMHAGIIYDNDNTSYYINPSSKSRLASNVGIGTTPRSDSYLLSMGSHIHMNNNSVNYVAQLHFNDNVRFYDNGNDRYLNYKYGNSGSGGIRVLDGGNQLQGYIYASGSQDFGLLDAHGNWAIRHNVDSYTNFYINNSLRMQVDGNGIDMAGNDINNVDKLDANTVDPVYNIGNSKYATYMAGMTGVKEETTGSVQLEKDNQDYTHTIDFQNLEKGSDLWVFYQTSDFGENWNNLSVLLTGDRNVGDATYEILTEEDKLVFYGEDSGRVSYRLTAPRFDHDKWDNNYKGNSKGLTVPDIK